MKILHILKTSEGAAWAWRQICVLKTLGIEVRVILPDIGKMYDRYLASGIEVYILNCDIANMRSIKTFSLNRIILNRIIAEFKPDILHSHFVGTTIFMRLAVGRNSGPPRIFQVPGPLHLESSIVRKAEIITAGKFDNWIATCELTKRLYLSEGIASERLGLSFYGTDVELLSKGSRGKLRPMLNLKPTTKLVGMIAYAYRPKRWLGQRTGIKGHEDLIDAVTILKSQNRDIALVFVGGPWRGAESYFEMIRSYAHNALGKSVFFVGVRNDIPDVYADLDVAVHPSHSENLGGAVESLLAKAPTVTTDVGGFPDIVIPNRTGWLCKSKSPESLAATIIDVLDHPEEAQRKVKNGFDLVMHELDVTRTAAQVYDFYKHVLNGVNAKGRT